MRLKPIRDQVVVIMGASSGIGRETALQFARRGARVVVSARDSAGLGTLVETIYREGGVAIAQVADVTNFTQVAGVAERAYAEYGRIDTWVHTAAVIAFAPFEELSTDEFRRVIEVDLLGQAYGARAALPYLRSEGRGALIHVTSLAARRALPLLSAYSAAKHGVDGLLESLRVELQHDGMPISVTQVMPGSINTPLFDKALTRLGVKPGGPPPYYRPSVVAGVILYAAEHPSRTLVVGGAAAGMLAMQRVAPIVMDWILARVGYASQRTSESKPADAPNNLFQPLPGFDRVESDVHALILSRSLYDWWETHPRTRRLAQAGLVLAAGTALTRQLARSA
jgi:NAD(P)-dependent dehydrogenase (short-subunit alcohol dehydrogenase family)